MLKRLYDNKHKHKDYQHVDKSLANMNLKNTSHVKSYKSGLFFYIKEELCERIITSHSDLFFLSKDKSIRSWIRNKPFEFKKKKKIIPIGI